MTAEDHPEELIELAKLGALAPADQARLDQHLAICAACAGHLAAGPQFERDLAPQPRDEILVQRALDRAMLRMDVETVIRGRPSDRSSKGASAVNGARLSPAWGRWLRVVAAGALIGSGLAAAATVAVRRVLSRAPLDPPAVAPVKPHVVRSASSPALPSPETPQAPETPQTPERTVEPPPSVPSLRAPTARREITAASLFERAGKLRRAGHVDTAITIYRRLQETFPDARETQLSFAVAGQLLLDRGRPSDALAEFDRGPRVGGDVGEETLVGRATALEQLHRAAEARTSWRTLLEHYPRSVYVGRARARLAALGDGR